MLVMTVKLPMFDFVIWRDDGARLYMHPNWRGIQIESHEGYPPNLPAQVPAKGKGKSDGHGAVIRTAAS